MLKTFFFFFLGDIYVSKVGVTDVPKLYFDDSSPLSKTVNLSFSDLERLAGSSYHFRAQMPITAAVMF